MAKFTMELKACTKTLGRPFDGDMPKCPLFKLIESYCLENGWERKVYGAHKTMTGYRCDAKFETLMKTDLDDETISIIYHMVIYIDCIDKDHGSKSILNVAIDTYMPDNKIISIDQTSEEWVLEDLRESILAEFTMG